MATPSRARTDMTLEEFLLWPRIDRRPYLEYFAGRIEVKVSPQRKHSLIEKRLTRALDQFAEPAGLGAACPELRCTFAGRSIVPDLVFQLDANIPRDAIGVVLDEASIALDIHIEIRSPGPSTRKTKDKLEHSLVNGCPLGWLIDPDRLIIDVYRPGPPPERLPADGFLDGTPVLPGFRLPVSEFFGWLKHPSQRPADPEVEPR